jgi:hypothetical protein
MANLTQERLAHLDDLDEEPSYASHRRDNSISSIVTLRQIARKEEKTDSGPIAQPTTEKKDASPAPAFSLSIESADDDNDGEFEFEIEDSTAAILFEDSNWILHMPGSAGRPHLNRFVSPPLILTYPARPSAHLNRSFHVTNLTNQL